MTRINLPADHRGASVIVTIDGRFLWAISARDLWSRVGGRLHLNYEGVGGGVEPYESFDEAAIRECREETGCEPELMQSPRTFILDDVRKSYEAVTNLETRPFMVWRKRVRGRKTLLACTYLARIRGTPMPKEEVPALLYAPPDVLFDDRAKTIRKLLEDGAELTERTRIPRSACVRPWGTPLYLRELGARGVVDLRMLGSLEGDIDSANG